MIDERLKHRLAGDVPRVPMERLRRHLRPSPVSLSRDVHLVTTAGEAEAMASAIARMNVVTIGIDAEFQYGDPRESGENDWSDLSRLRVISIGLAVRVRDTRGAELVVGYTVDVRRNETHSAVGNVLRLPVTFVAHHVKSELCALRALGLPWPRALFCTWTAARLLTLGIHHARYEIPDPADDEEEVEAEQRADKRRYHATSLVGLARTHGVSFPFEFDKAAMQRRYLKLRDEEQLTPRDARYVVGDAYVALALHGLLRSHLVEAGLDHHYDHVELPAVLVLIDCERAGITVRREKLDIAQTALSQALFEWERELGTFGFRPSATPRTLPGASDGFNVRSYAERARVLGKLGLLAHFARPRQENKYSFRKELLKRNRGLHRVVELLYLHSRYGAVLRDRLFDGEYICADCRIRPWINPLGADTGRTSFKRPNVVSLSKAMRPVVGPDDDAHGLAELDFKFEEPLIAAAHFGDSQLLADCTEGDPYVRMMRGVCRNDIAPEHLALDDDELGARYETLRSRVKIVMLAVLYGSSDASLAAMLGIPERAARRLKAGFLARYPKLREGMEQAQRLLQERGYAVTVTGMKRFRGREGALSGWERRWAVNFPIQGGGACVLKMLLPRLATFLAKSGGRLILPVFDAVVIQFPLDRKSEVCAGAARIMIEVFQELYSGTCPRVDINSKDPTCWNKNGRGDSIERFLQDPEFKP